MSRDNQLQRCVPVTSTRVVFLMLPLRLQRQFMVYELSLAMSMFQFSARQGLHVIYTGAACSVPVERPLVCYVHQRLNAHAGTALRCYACLGGAENAYSEIRCSAICVWCSFRERERDGVPCGQMVRNLSEAQFNSPIANLSTVSKLSSILQESNTIACSV